MEMFRALVSRLEPLLLALLLRCCRLLFELSRIYLDSSQDCSFMSLRIWK